MRKKRLLSLLLCLALVLAPASGFGMTAAAEGETVQVSVVSDPPEGGTIALGDRTPAAADSAAFPKGEKFTLTAAPAEGYRLAYWTYSPNALGTIPMGNAGSLTYTPNAPSQNTTYTAHFISTATEASAVFVGSGSVEIDELDLGTETVGYRAYSGSNVSVGQRLMLKNTGQCPLAPANVAFRLEGEDAASFHLVKITLNPDGVLNPSATLSTWYICPENGLAAGEYECTVTFLERCQGGLSEPVSLKVKFKVTEDAVVRTKIGTAGGGTASGDGIYKQGETITLTAAPSEHYSFNKWFFSTTAEYFTDNPLVLEADASKAGTYTAYFTLCESHVIVNCEGEGKVLLEGQEPADSYDLWIPADQSLTATAVPAEGWRLAYWKNAAGTAFYGDPGSLEYETRGAVTAVFLSRDVKTDVKLINGAGSSELLDLGTASEGYRAFSTDTSGSTYYIKQTIRAKNTGDCMIPLGTACFKLTGENADCFRVGRQYLSRDAYLDPGQSMGYPWVVYPINGLSEGVYEATVTFVELCQGGIDPPASIPVRFEVTKAYEITAEVEGGKGGKVTGAGFCPAGEAVTLTAAADTNYAFDHWTRGDGTESTENPLIFVPAAAEKITAHFRRTGYSVHVSADPAAGGTVVDGAGEPAVDQDNLPEGTIVTLRAVPKEGYLLGYWKDNGNLIAPDEGTEDTVTVTANLDHALVAYFVKPSVKGLLTGTGVRAVVTAPAGAMVIAVRYGDGGQLADLQALTLAVGCVERNIDFKLNGSGRIKLLLLESSESCAPLCAPKVFN